VVFCVFFLGKKRRKMSVWEKNLGLICERMF
jgi:hypothetical protein